MKTQLKFIVAVLFTSCAQESNQTASPRQESSLAIQAETIVQPSVGDTLGEFIHTKYIHSEGSNYQLVIENSFPKGGFSYTDTHGNALAYVVFWTRITNKGSSPIDLHLDFPASAFELHSSPGINFKIYMPLDTMDARRAPLENYGLNNIESLLDDNLDKGSSRTYAIAPKQSHAFYAVVLTSGRINGTVRAGLKLDGRKAFYSVNGVEVPCGSF
ncbi:hypothetical protein [Phaeocystidibacter marisrubri]|uniref:Uncharacterized protein n=1 Tax=Phaeocystidibacter marisrubri TaxID=1577780 RepID=A0A6L3ZCM6_9FLAO|nr:hypothetical protein [Phaeocystidibacter marisrubri]KAB2815621.1 hypothetical protein F8C82_07920 [Phaeocystidibacter marisrubri]GGH64841.1 hypothetical protein GCM10011318_01260 [Phaeocystidibacter marisrubri]